MRSDSPTYAEMLRKAMRSFEPPMTRQDLRVRMQEVRGDGDGFSYEHVRKIVGGFPLMSEKFNDEVCEVLGLDPVEMWKLGLREKLKRSGTDIAEMVVPDPRLKNIWNELTAEDQERYLRIGEGMVETRRVERAENDEYDPAEIRKRISVLMHRLSPGSTGGATARKRSERQQRAVR